VWNSITVLLSGYVIGIAIASLLTTLAVATRFGSDLLSTLTAMLNPLPAIALLPMAMLWFGLGKEAIVFTLLHSVVWPVALNMHTGFMGVSDTQRMVGRNYGLRGLSYVIKLLIPAAFPSILTGMKIGWAYAWRTLIAAELVFGGSVIDAAGTDAGGLGWFIFANQMDLRIPYVFAGLFTVILVGVLMESIVFRNLETRTVIRWGMQDQ
jgi:NitT/TauT family transport system permease protein